jgi:predicted DNA-binding protein with PD1-like motif
MTHHSSVNLRELFMGALPFGSDLLQGLTDVCLERNVTLGRVEAIGAVRSARIGFYNQETRSYQFLSLDMPLEITSLVGNVSLKDGEPFVHAHITLADEKGIAHGGHLAPGTKVFACEFVIEAFDGPRFERGYDEETGLPLWSK